MPSLRLASFLNKVSRSQISPLFRSFRWIAELRDGLQFTIRPLLQLLRDEDRYVRSAAASALGKFAEQCESQRDIIATSLIWMDSGAS